MAPETNYETDELHLYIKRELMRKDLHAFLDQENLPVITLHNELMCS